MDFVGNPEYDGHEGVYSLDGSDSGLRAIIAIHSTRLGPAAGGCRRWHYANDSEALTDALRLSKCMSYKNAMAGLPFGGGKAVILSDAAQPKSRDEFQAFGRFVQSLNGRYVTAEDVGVGTDDMCVVREVTPYVSGLPQAADTGGGDPSPWTALGVFLSITAAVQHQFGLSSLEEIKVAVQGVGHVGYQLCKLLHGTVAQLFVTDINPASADRVNREFNGIVIAPDEIVSAPVDVLAPCALGGILNYASIPKVQAHIIAGAANNQLSTQDDAMRLHERGILFLPDYVINAGGIIAVAREYLGGSNRDVVEQQVRQIPHRVAQLLQTAERKNIPPLAVADRKVQTILRRSSNRSQASASHSM